MTKEEYLEQLKKLVEANPVNWAKIVSVGRNYSHLKEWLNQFEGERVSEKYARASGLHEQKFCLACGEPTKFVDLTKGFRMYCNATCQNKKIKLSNVDSALEKLNGHGDFSYHGGFDGVQSYVDVTNNVCGHRFKVIFRNIFKNANYCPTCGAAERSANLAAFNAATYEAMMKRLYGEAGYSAESYQKYARLLTGKTYQANIDVLNPNRLPFGRPDWRENSYNLDHIVPISVGYKMRIDPDLIASVENLRVIPASENLKKYNLLTPESEALIEKWAAQKVTLHHVNDQILRLLDGIEFDDIVDGELSVKISLQSVAVYVIKLSGADDQARKNEVKRIEAADGNKFVIFEGELYHKFKQIKNRLLHVLKQNNQPIYARKCEIRTVNHNMSAAFLIANHLQGKDNASVRLGLYYRDELVALMTFGKPRYSKDYEYELYRFASSGSVVGAASRLLKHFEKEYAPKSIVSYADLRFGTGNLYDVLGFKRTHNSSSNYFYYKDDMELETRVKFQKHKLKEQLETYDESLTEVENMNMNGWNRVFDLGNAVYVKQS